jgi:hypothetical protein
VRGISRPSRRTTTSTMSWSPGDSCCVSERSG